ncbi:DEMETER-like protein 3 [Hirschfeldia incana]|nr:DEMETER-like protein 3 [Hirschfeldia incana]
MEKNSQDPNQVSGLVGQETPVKPKPPLKFYVRRKFTKRLNKLQNVDDSATSPQKIKSSELANSDLSSDFNIENTTKEEFVKKSEEPENFKVDLQSLHSTQGNKDSKEEIEEKNAKSTIVQDDSQYVNGEGKENHSEKIRKKQRYHRPRIMEDGKKPRDHTNLRMRTISKKRSKKEKDDEDVFEVRTPEKQSFPKKRNNKANKNVARSLALDEEEMSSTTCLALELGRSSIPNFPKGKRRMTTLRRTDFHVLISPSFPMPIWKKHSKRSTRKKNMVRWTRNALCFECLEETLLLVEVHPSEKDIKRIAPELNLMHSNQKITVGSKERLKKAKKVGKLVTKEKNHEKDNGHVDVAVQTKDIFITASSCVAPNSRTKEMKDMLENLIFQLNYQKDHNLSSLADVPLHIEETLMNSVSYITPKESTKKATKGVAKLIKEMDKLNINRRGTTLGKAKKKLVNAKVNLDPETVKEWELLMENDPPDISHVNDEETECKWKEERTIFQSRIELFINRMHFLQGNRKFKQWKGSVVDSVVGVFLTQNVSDYLSSNAFMSVAAKFPVNAKDSLESLAYFIDEPQEVNNLVGDGQIPIQNEKDDPKNSLGSVSLQENLEQHEKDAKRKNKKTGIMEDETVDWESLRKVYTKERSRNAIHMDTVDWNAVRLSDQQVLADTIMKRGQHNGLARKILKFLNEEAKQNGCVDLEWLRDAPSDLVKRYLLEIEGIGLKSAECVRLLGLKHSAFPVDTNVGRIAVRLGWVPLEPLPDGVQLHHLFQYPSMDSIQKYLWPRLCKLPQETLYELHYQMITFGKVFCTKVIPNCNACPMKSECKYFASAYVSSKVLLEGPEENTQASQEWQESQESQENTQASQEWQESQENTQASQEWQESQENTQASQEWQESQESDTSYCHDDDAKMTSTINLIEECVFTEGSNQTDCCEPIVEFPSSPTREIPELPDIEDTPCRSTCRPNYAIPRIDFDMDALKKNVVDAFMKGATMFNGFSDEISKALAVMTPENACIPMKLPRKTKYYDRLRTEHVVYVLPDNHELLNDFERRERDDPSPYLLALWQPGETSYSFMPPKKKCDSDGTNLCMIKTCSYCWSIREESSNTYRGTILIPCRTAMRAGFPLNGTYFQTNEVFADHETSVKPIVFSRELCNGLEKRALYCGSSVTSIFRMLDGTRVQLCFWTGFVCMRGFDRKQRTPEGLVRRLHTPPDERGEKHMRD